MSGDDTPTAAPPPPDNRTPLEVAEMAADLNGELVEAARAKIAALRADLARVTAERDAIKAGESAAERNCPDTDNPHPPGSAEYCKWQNAYWGERSHREKVKALRLLCGGGDVPPDADLVALVRQVLADLARLRQENAALRAANIELHEWSTVVLLALRWTGDGYEWCPPTRDYREDPASAARAMLDERYAVAARLAAERDAARAEADRLRAELKEADLKVDVLRWIIGDAREKVRDLQESGDLGRGLADLSALLSPAGPEEPRE